MDEETLSLEAHRRGQFQDLHTVRCAKCGKSILATSLRCSECGVHFQGEAQDFFHPSEQQNAHARRNWVVVTAIILLLIAVAGIFAAQ